MKFDRIAPLGSGGFGEVWKCHDRTLGVDRAVKFVPKTRVSDEDEFYKESRTLQALSNPHIVQVYEAGEEGGEFYIAMELMPGGSMEVASGHPVPMRRSIARVAHEPCAAVAIDGADKVAPGEPVVVVVALDGARHWAGELLADAAVEGLAGAAVPEEVDVASHWARRGQEAGGAAVVQDGRVHQVQGFRGELDRSRNGATMGRSTCHCPESESGTWRPSSPKVVGSSATTWVTRGTIPWGGEGGKRTTWPN